MLDIAKNQNRTTHLYMEVYEYYKKLILDGKMAPGSKMPACFMREKLCLALCAL